MQARDLLNNSLLWLCARPFKIKEWSRRERFVSRETTTMRAPFIEERPPLLQQAMDIVAEECPATLTVFNPQVAAFGDYIGGYWYQSTTL